MVTASGKTLAVVDWIIAAFGVFFIFAGGGGLSILLGGGAAVVFFWLGMRAWKSAR